jgi:D-amino peptidase
MRVYLSVDMEGVAGVVHEDQTNPIDPNCAGEYGRFRRIMTGEANAAVEGAVAAGATRVVVNDSHWLMRNLLAEDLHPAAELVSGSTKPRSMLEGIEEGFDAACFIGYHARAGTAHAILDHTYTSRIFRVTLNGQEVGELGLNAALAGRFGVPVALVSGDQALAAECEALLGEGTRAVVVKHAVARHGARSLAPEEARRRIREGVTPAVRKPPKPWTVSSPATIEVEFCSSHHADMAELAPGSERLGARAVRVTHADYAEAFSAFRALYNLASVP